MKRRIVKKLCGRTGETIAETLVALLISALALMMLAGAIAAANRVIERSEAEMQAYYKANRVLASGTMPAGEDVSASLGEVKVMLKDKNVSEGTRVTYYKSCVKNNVFSQYPVLAYITTGE